MNKILSIAIGIMFLLVLLPLIAVEVSPNTDNLFNKESADEGKILTLTGDIETSALYSTSDYIEIDNTMPYIVGGVSGDVTIALYDDTFTYISSNTYNSVTAVDVLSTNDTQYIKFSYLTTDVSTVRVNEGFDVLPYTEYNEPIDTPAFNLLKLMPLIIMGGSILFLTYNFTNGRKS